jgi:hypothetical protein
MSSSVNKTKSTTNMQTHFHEQESHPDISVSGELMFEAAKVEGIDAVKLLDPSQSVMIAPHRIAETQDMDMRTWVSQEPIAMIGADHAGNYGVNRVGYINTDGQPGQALLLTRLPDEAGQHAVPVAVIGGTKKSVTVPGDDGELAFGISRDRRGVMTITKEGRDDITVAFAESANVAPGEDQLAISAIRRHAGVSPKSAHNPLTSHQAKQVWSVPGMVALDYLQRRRMAK